ncbi:hypothetical protein X474_25335 [Dethiosulfatarculus sandiegensis]|uniref:Uncharacterized protein n=1 Tax=Dethiosulfatarculus sandiegensis TaxID=1429043 RepID=A0A0D2HKL9_9BACT|nr:hypothetical protein X474_25335 [Dethiosulfatarculus sandiegensis]
MPVFYNKCNILPLLDPKWPGLHAAHHNGTRACLCLFRQGATWGGLNTEPRGHSPILFLLPTKKTSGQGI